MVVIVDTYLDYCLKKNTEKNNIKRVNLMIQQSKLGLLRF